VTGHKIKRYAIQTRLICSEFDTHDNIDAAIDAAISEKEEK
jgi:hypothetical protein